MPPSRLLGDYRPSAAGFDEMVGPDGQVREHWRAVSGAFDDLGFDELTRRAREVTRLLEEDGVTYHIHTPSPATPVARPAGQTTPAGQTIGANRWQLDAVPSIISSWEWAGIESGVAERAEVLSAVLEDLYGPRQLMARGLLPPEVVFSHPGFLRPCDGVRIPGGQQLFSYGADLVRAADGSWSVLADRSQTPSGFGYALENRQVVSRVFPSVYRNSQVHRLAPFFRSLRAALQDAAPPGVDDPRIVVLTPGPWNETAFEHAFLASRLGYPLVEGSDLVVRDGKVWLQTLARLEPVHVILRRVDGSYCDPVELRPESRLGVPGLMQACRLGTVSVVNTIGSSVLESPGLAAFLPGIAKALLGRPLGLPGVATWWCGDEHDRKQVLSRLAELTVKPVERGNGAIPIFGWELSHAELEELRRRIEAHPTQWVGQDPVTPATTPTLTSDGLEDRGSVLRAFAVARGSSYIVMPGGLTRIAARAGEAIVSNQAGGSSKDTWVLTSEPERLTGFWLNHGPAVEAADPVGALSSRAAEQLFWLGRYAERAEDLARLLRVVHDRQNEFEGSPNPSGTDCVTALLLAVTAVSTTYPGFLGPGGAGRLSDPEPELLSLVVDQRRPGTVAHALRHLLDNTYSVRDHLSPDTWLVVGVLDTEIVELSRPPHDAQAVLQGALRRVLQGLLALSGLAAESMVRDPGWFLMDAGRRVERSLQLLALLRTTVCEERDTATDSLLLESVLTAAESIITYRRRYRSQGQLETALDLLLLDAGNPRSVVYQLDRLTTDLAALPHDAGMRLPPEERLLLEASTALRLMDTAVLAPADGDGRRPSLATRLDDLSDLLRRVAVAIDTSRFLHPLPQWSVLTPADSHLVPFHPDR